jgi:cytochrome c oxidase subunit 1
VLSSAGASILAVGYLLTASYLLYSIWWGEKAGANPWKATGLEWTIQSPPLPENFTETPIVTEGAYAYSKREMKVA